MGKKITIAEFIKRAKEVHGDKYDYSKANYVTTHTKVILICPKHGEFQQSPAKHLSGQGCPLCSGNKLGTKGSFISKAEAVHGKRYDYSKVAYINNQRMVTIICPEHGEFQQAPANHLVGKGCIQCGFETRAKKKTKTTKQFIKESEQIHGDIYDYSQVKYTGKEKEVKIICSEHGEFNQKANVHLMGCGCPKCGLLTISNKKRLSQDYFVERSAKAHKDKYNYSLVNYQGIDKKIKIICPEHGLFKQTPNTHIHGGGCPACVGLERYGTDEFIRRASEVHNNKYDYSKVKYINAKKPVSIICPEHGEFKQIAQHHLKGVGCTGCAGYGINLQEPGILYYLRVETRNQLFWKIGITNKTVEDRFKSEMNKITVLKTWHYKIMQDGYKREQELIHQFSVFRCNDNETPLTSGGNTELFIRDVLGLDAESE